MLELVEKVSPDKRVAQLCIILQNLIQMVMFFLVLEDPAGKVVQEGTAHLEMMLKTEVKVVTEKIVLVSRMEPEQEPMEKMVAEAVKAESAESAESVATVEWAVR
jgi:hypothetical protein